MTEITLIAYTDNVEIRNNRDLRRVEAFRGSLQKLGKIRRLADGSYSITGVDAETTQFLLTTTRQILATGVETTHIERDPDGTIHEVIDIVSPSDPGFLELFADQFGQVSGPYQGRRVGVLLSEEGFDRLMALVKNGFALNPGGREV